MIASIFEELLQGAKCGIAMNKLSNFMSLRSRVFASLKIELMSERKPDES
jgi:hypothetical protein